MLKKIVDCVESTNDQNLNLTLKGHFNQIANRHIFLFLYVATEIALVLCAKVLKYLSEIYRMHQPSHNEDEWISVYATQNTEKLHLTNSAAMSFQKQCPDYTEKSTDLTIFTVAPFC